MKTLKRYLQKATRGLPARKRQEVWQELEADILERVQVLQAFGHSEQQALERVLQQLGSPQGIQQGMQGIYLWPRVRKTFAGTLFAGALVLALSAPTLAELVVTQQPPVPYCSPNTFQSSNICIPQGWESNFGWVEVDSLVQELNAAGIPSRVEDQTLVLQFPEKTLSISLQNDGGSPTPTAFERDGKTHLHINTLLTQMFFDLTTPLRLEGVHNPTLHIGKAALRLPNHNATQMLEVSVGEALMKEHHLGSFGHGGALPAEASNSNKQVKAQLKGTPGTPYALVYLSSLGTFMVEVAEAQADGKVSFRASLTRSPELRAVGSFQELSVKGSKGTTGVLVLKLNGLLNRGAKPYQVVQNARFE